MGKRSLRPRRNGDNGDSDTNAAAGRKRYFRNKDESVENFGFRKSELSENVTPKNKKKKTVESVRVYLVEFLIKRVASSRVRQYSDDDRWDSQLGKMHTTL